MATIKYNRQSFTEALEPGICAFVVHEFEERLQEKLQNIVDEIYEELRKELPTKIKTKIACVLDEKLGGEKMCVIVDLKGESDAR